MNATAERLRDLARELLAIADKIDRATPIVTSRSSQLMRDVIAAIPDNGDETRIGSIVHCVELLHGVDSRKAIYNVLGYLTRKGKIERLRYGRYKLKLKMEDTTHERSAAD